jgi:hypothetical protein
MDKIRQEGGTELGAILELQKMIAEELDLSAEERSFSRSFTPLTDGLGLESPKKKEFPTPPPARELSRVVRKTAEMLLETEPEEISEPEEPEVPVASEVPEVPDKTGSLASVINTSSSERERVTEDEVSEPPPMPRPSLWRRTFAAFVDEMFVLSLWVVAVFITLKALDGSVTYFSFTGFQAHHHPMLIKFALLEFSTLWLCYFAVCLGLMDMTFGMWVWGIRIGYLSKKSGINRFFRILLSFMFFAPVFPLILLTVRRHGRNLLDALSGSHLYRSMV